MIRKLYFNINTCRIKPLFYVSIITFFFILLMISCTKEEAEFRTGEIVPDVVNGYYMRDNFGNLMMTVGSPNVKLNNSPDGNPDNAKYSITVFPNPVVKGYNGNIFIKGPDSTLKRVWISRANIPGEVNNLNRNVVKVGGDPVLQFSTKYSQLNFSANSYHNGSLQEGFYRVYVQVGDVLLYDNLVIVDNSK